MRQIITLALLLLGSAGLAQNVAVYVSDAGNFNNPPWQILRFDGNGANPSVFIGTNLNWPQDILFLADSNTVLISNLGSNRITRHNANSGSYINDFATGIAGPTRTKIGPDGLLYVLQWNGSGTVRRYQLDGTYMGEFTTVGVPQSIGLDWDAAGNLYVSSYNGDLVRKYDTAGVDLGLFIDSNLAGPTNIWFDANGDLLVSDYDATSVKRFDSSGNFLGDFLTGLSNSEGVAYLPNGDILMGNGATNSVKRFAPNGTYLQEFIDSGAGNLITPNAVVIREVPLVVPELAGPEIGILYPALGSEFHRTKDVANERIRVEIYNNSGHFVELMSGTTWHATNVAEGVYVVLARFPDGTSASQKIVVAK